MKKQNLKTWYLSIWWALDFYDEFDHRFALFRFKRHSRNKTKHFLKPRFVCPCVVNFSPGFLFVHFFPLLSAFLWEWCLLTHIWTGQRLLSQCPCLWSYHLQQIKGSWHIIYALLKGWSVQLKSGSKALLPLSWKKKWSPLEWTVLQWNADLVCR